MCGEILYNMCWSVCPCCFLPMSVRLLSLSQSWYLFTPPNPPTSFARYQTFPVMHTHSLSLRFVWWEVLTFLHVVVTNQALDSLSVCGCLLPFMCGREYWLPWVPDATLKTDERRRKEESGHVRHALVLPCQLSVFLCDSVCVWEIVGSACCDWRHCALPMSTRTVPTAQASLD